MLQRYQLRLVLRSGQAKAKGQGFRLQGGSSLRRVQRAPPLVHQLQILRQVSDRVQPCAGVNTKRVRGIQEVLRKNEERAH